MTEQSEMLDVKLNQLTAEKSRMKKEEKMETLAKKNIDS
jgi:hypothetical protein